MHNVYFILSLTFCDFDGSYKSEVYFSVFPIKLFYFSNVFTSMCFPFLSGNKNVFIVCYYRALFSHLNLKYTNKSENTFPAHLNIPVIWDAT